MVRRAHDPYRGRWGLPGGAVELGETVHAALRREVMEETGIAIDVGHFLVYKDAISRDAEGRVRFHYVVFFFTARPVGGTLAADSDAAEARWVECARLPELDLTPGADDVLRLAALWPEN